MAVDEEDYEAVRLSNIARNKALLESLGLSEFKIPDAPAKTSKASNPSSKKRKTASTKKRKGSDDTAVEDSDSEQRARTPKRPKLKSEGSDDTLVGTRRSSRNVQRVSYANDGVYVAAARARKVAASEDEDETDSEFNSEASDDAEDGSDDEKGGKAKKNKSKKKKNGGRRLVQGLVDDTKLRNVAKMGERSHDP